MSLARYPYRLGLAGANQRAVELATGEFILHLDGDDISVAGRVESQVAYLKANPRCVAVGSRVATIGPYGEVGRAMDLPIGADVRRNLTRSNVLVHSATAFRADSLAKVGGYDLDLEHMEDYGLVLKLAMLGPIANLGVLGALYRLHGSQVSRKFRPRGHYVNVIMGRRRALAQLLGIGFGQRFLNDVWYMSVQWGMFTKGRLLPLAPRLFRSASR